MRAHPLYADARNSDALAGAVVAAQTRAAGATIVLRKGVPLGGAGRA